ncbi:hypothetical protein HYT01_01195 [Candidatus Giovannonibacteria bacterium]|nr:hypothetical protein [Candidatus Giovannonibacteria bacterium]
MNKPTAPIRKQKLPVSFKRLLWSYDFNAIDAEQYKRTIIVNVVNYGNLSEWRWIKKHYGRLEIKKILHEIKPTEIRNGARKLASLILAAN